MQYLGSIAEILYQNEKNGYTVAFFESEEDAFMVVGYLAGVSLGERLQIEGKEVEHPRYGTQFQVERYEPAIPTGRDHLRNFLASGNIRGVGDVMAKRLVDHFGEEVLDILEQDPRQLLQVEGIGEKTLENIVTSYRDIASRRDTLLFLQQLGITSATMAKVLKDYGDHVKEIITANPYQLYLDYPHLGFEKVDEIAGNLGFSYRSSERIHAACFRLLQKATGEGHVFLPFQEVLDQLSLQLSIDRLELEEMLLPLMRLGSLSLEDDRLYLSKAWEAEEMLSMDILRILLDDQPALEDRGSVENFERKEQVQFDASQKAALDMAFTNNLSIITGGPGTGKTTLIQALLAVAESHHLRSALCAPTGRASKRMEEATGHVASTIHRLLEFQFSEDEQMLYFQRDRMNPLATDLLILDEASMVDQHLMAALLCAVDFGTRVVILGDADQLAPVGPGKVLQDMIDSGVVPVARLENIFRQKESSLIPINAHRVIRGERDLLMRSEGDFFFMRASDSREVKAMLEDLMLRRLPAYGLDPLKDIQVLTPMKKGPLGTFEINRMLQQLLVPEEYRIRGFQVGDKVMQTKNDYHLTWRDARDFDEGQGVFNGDIGVVTALSARHRQLKVLFDDTREVEYSFDQLDHLEHAYAMTVHKSQGSEFPCVIVLLGYVPEMLRNRHVIYTAMTRARKLLIFLGSGHSLRQMIEHQQEEVRNTWLSQKLKAQWQIRTELEYWRSE